jgi:transposase
MFLRRCYVPEPVDEMWSRLRHLGARREQLITEAGSQIQQMRTCWNVRGRRCWTRPGSRSGWRPGWRPCRAGVIAHRPGALERVQLLFEDWQLTKTGLAAAGQRMTSVLAELGLTALATSITGLSPVGAAAILAETGDKTRLTGQGRPGLRLAAWRAVWGAQRANPVCRARYQHLTSRADNKLTPTQAQTVIAAAILRQLHAVITTGQEWDPATAAHGTRRNSRRPNPITAMQGQTSDEAPARA